MCQTSIDDGSGRPLLRSLEKTIHACRQLFPLCQLTFPDHQDGPAVGKKRINLSCVSFDVLVEFVFPESRSRRRHRLPVLARMPMPETSMYEYHRAILGENHIRLAGQALAVGSEAVSHSMQDTTDQHFRLRVARSDLRHVVSALLFGQYISQLSYPAAASLLIVRLPLRFSRHPLPRFSCVSRITSTTLRATASTTCGQTAFPNCLYACVSDTGTSSR